MSTPSQNKHTLSLSEQQYVDQMKTQDRALHDLAIQKLGTSYFVKWTHGYKKWFKTTSVSPAPALAPATTHNTPSPVAK